MLPDHFSFPLISNPMPPIKFLPLLLSTLALSPALAQTTPPPSARPATLTAAPPVHTNISGAGTLPDGMFFAALNPGFSDQTHSKKGYTGPDTASQAWLLKLRYGLTNRLEINSVLPYVKLTFHNPTPARKHLEGYGDQSLGLGYGLYNLHLGDPFALSVTASVLLPTAPKGDNHLPGNSAWGGRISAEFGVFLTPDLKLDTGIVASAPFERGNQSVKRGEEYQWNTQLRYMFTHFDVGIESSLVRAESGDRRTPAGRVNLKTGSTLWHVGPSVNYALDQHNVWLGVGVFFPVEQRVEGPTRVDRHRWAVKVGKVW